MFFTVIPIFMVTGTGSTLGVFQGTAVFLTCSAVIRKLAVLVHSKTRFANRVSAWQLLWVFSIAFVKRDCAFTEINVLDGIVDFLYVVSFIGNKSTFLNR